YRSTDGGRSWTRVLPADGAVGASDVYLDYADPQIVYALLLPGGAPGGAQTSGPGAYKSTDGGVTWQPVTAQGLPDGARMSAFAVSSGTHGRRLYAVAAAGGGRGAGGSGRAPGRAGRGRGPGARRPARAAAPSAKSEA